MPFGLHRAFHSTVASRMALLFVVCTVLPVGVFTAFTLNGTVGALEERARRVLHRDARQLGQEALGQLDLLARSLHALADDLNASVSTGRAAVRPSAARLDVLFSHPPESVTYLPAAGAAIPIRGERLELELSPGQQQHLEDWGRLLTTTSTPPHRRALVVRASPPATAAVAAVIDEARLFGLDAEDALPPDSDACVMAGLRVLACSPSAPPDIVGNCSTVVRPRTAT